MFLNVFLMSSSPIQIDQRHQIERELSVNFPFIKCVWLSLSPLFLLFFNLLIVHGILGASSVLVVLTVTLSFWPVWAAGGAWVLCLKSTTCMVSLVHLLSGSEHMKLPLMVKNLWIWNFTHYRWHVGKGDTMWAQELAILKFSFKAEVYIRFAQL